MQHSFSRRRPALSVLAGGIFALGLFAASIAPAAAWKNGPPEHKVTTRPEDCAHPPYSTHDWIADHARALLPARERAWLDPWRNLLLIGTEAPDYRKITAVCGTPNRGYGDTGHGHHDLRFAADGSVTYDLPARRADEEYAKAVAAYRAGRPGDAAYFLGAVAHYIGDLSQYGHTIKGEVHHHDYEEAVGALTRSFDGGHVFEAYIRPRPLVTRRAYDAVVRTGRFTWEGRPPLLPPAEMDRRYTPGALVEPDFRASVGTALNKAVNETADVLHTFYEEVVRRRDGAR